MALAEYLAWQAWHLDERNAAASLSHGRHLWADLPQELMWQNKHQKGGICAGARQVWIGDDVIRKFDPLEKGNIKMQLSDTVLHHRRVES